MIVWAVALASAQTFCFIHDKNACNFMTFKCIIKPLNEPLSADRNTMISGGDILWAERILKMTGFKYSIRPVPKN